MDQPIETDALVIGAGPAGLFQVFQLGLQDIRSHVVEALPHAGGQCIELYADKPIYDIPAVKVCTGRELTQQLLNQAAPFSPSFHFNQLVSALARRADGRFDVTTQASAGANDAPRHFITRTVIVAAGVGAFLPRTLSIEGLSAFEGGQLLHRLQPDHNFSGQRVVISGDGDEALEWALKLCPAHLDGYPHKAQSVTVIHRRDQFSANPTLVEMFRACVAQGAIQFVASQPIGIETRTGQLTALQVALPEGGERTIEIDRLLVLQGLSPKLGPIAKWGLDLERKQLQVSAHDCATSEPGIFAVGDINTYPGKKKLILCGFHEATLAAFGAADIVHPNRKTLLQYTTTSSELHRLLGVS